MKQIVVLGGGISGYGSAILAKKKGFGVFLSDAGRIADRYKAKLDEWEVPYEEGGHTEERILAATEVVKSPGIPDTAPMVRKIREAGIPVISEMEFAGRYMGKAKCICITGSNGKTTTTSLIYKIMRDAGMNVALGGNIGESFAWSVATGDYDWYVLELSSFQLDGMYRFRAHVGVLMKLVGWGVAAIVVIMTLNLGRSETAEGRVSTWIHLWTKSQTEKPIEHLSDTERSMIAIYNGGILGEGAGQSAMRVEMIHPESDYAYAFFVEEYGFILAVLLLMLYLWVFFRGIEIFRRCGTAFPGLLVLGLALLITCQALLHIMVTVNLIPETGQTLPLIARGGSSMLFTMIAFGMILSVSRQNDEQSHDRPKSETLYEK